jgi:hypothetical protein
MVPPFSNRISRVPLYSNLLELLPIRGYHSLWLIFPDHSGCFSRSIGLVRVRSPLLTESRLISFPLGTEMFHFPRFASIPLYIQGLIPSITTRRNNKLLSIGVKRWVSPFGHLRINGCSHLPVTYRSVPRPSSPVHAKASPECP